MLANNDAWVYKLRKETILALLKHGYSVYISSPRGEFSPIMEQWGCVWIESKLERRGKNLASDLKLFTHYIGLIKNIKPNVVLSYTIKPNLYGGLASRLLNTPYICNITGLGSGFSGNSILKKLIIQLYKHSLKKANCVFFQNNEDQKILQEHGIVKNNYQVIPGSGVNLDEYQYKSYPPMDSKITFTFIGRIMKDKGIDEFLEAAKAIKQKYENTSFTVIGFIEPTQVQYSEKIKQYSEDGYIEYVGFQKNVIPYIEQSHCIIQPSHGGEGMSNVLLETAAIGRPLIASDIPGCRETIVEGENGYLFFPKDTKSLVSKIEIFLSLPYTEKIILGINSRSKVEREFDRRIVTKEYLKKINNIFDN